MKKTKKVVLFITVMTSVMLMSFTSAFAHCGGGRGRGYYRSNYSASSYSCPYGNAICNQNGYCIDHSQYYTNNVAPATVPQNTVPATNNELTIATVNNNVSDNTIVEEPVIKEILNTAVPNTVVPNTVVPNTAYVCPYGNAICNEYGYCINNGYCNGGGYGCARYGRCGGRYVY